MREEAKLVIVKMLGLLESHQKDNYGRTALDYATNYHRSEACIAKLKRCIELRPLLLTIALLPKERQDEKYEQEVQNLSSELNVTQEEYGRLKSLVELSDDFTRMNLLREAGVTALMLAAANGHVDCVKLLKIASKDGINDKDELGHTALDYATKYGHEDCVQELLNLGADE